MIPLIVMLAIALLSVFWPAPKIEESKLQPKNKSTLFDMGQSTTAYASIVKAINQEKP